MIGLRSGECRQERVVHIDDCGRKLRHELRRQNLHIPSQHHQLDFVTRQKLELPRFRVRTRLGRHRHELERHAVERSQIFCFAMIRNDDRDFADKLAGAPAVQQIGHAMEILRAEERNTRRPRARRKLPRHPQLGSHRREH